MTRAEKFKEVFGLKVDTDYADCGLFDCSDIDSCASCPVLYTQSWWEQEYVSPITINLEILEPQESEDKG